MKYSIAIVEDNAIEAENIKNYIARFAQETDAQFDISTFSDGSHIVFDYRPDFDIIFFDIEMEHLDGMSAAQYIRKQDKNVIIIFITNMAQYAIKGYSLDALNYLLKPVPYFAFSQELKRSIEKIDKKRTSFVLLETNEEMVRLQVGEILYVESLKHKVVVVTKDKEYTKTGTVREIEKLLMPHNFFRCNYGCLVNLAAVTGIYENCAVIGDIRQPISRARKKAFMEALTAYYGERSL